MFNAETITNIANAAYVVAALLFILALAGLSKHETSKAGNAFGMAGMAVALIATITLAINKQIEPLGLALLIGAMAIGAAIGLWRARVVEMTGMPELIALLHSFVGLAAVLVGWSASSTARARSSSPKKACSASTPPRSSSASSSVR